MKMRILYRRIGLVSAGFLAFSGSVGLAQQGQWPVPQKDSTAGAQGRGVRIIAPDAPPPTPVADTPQSKPTKPTADAVKAPASRPQTDVGPRPPAPVMPPVLKACDRPIGNPTLRFGDPTGFDALLRRKLRGGRTVSIDLESPYPADNEAPAPIGAWLNEVQKSGGTVSVDAYCQKGRGFGQFFAKIFGGGPADPYKAARKYDAVLHVDTVDQVVTQIEFVRRKAAQ